MKRYSFEENPTVFGKILRDELPSRRVYEDEMVLAFHNIAPKAKTHILIIPKQHIESLQDLSEADASLMGHILIVANHIARDLGFNDHGFRLISNAGKGGGQEVPHLHFHLLANDTPLADAP